MNPLRSLRKFIGDGFPSNFWYIGDNSSGREERTIARGCRAGELPGALQQANNHEKWRVTFYGDHMIHSDRPFMLRCISCSALMCIALLFGACVSSEETGTGKRIGAPVSSQAVSDSVRVRVDSMMRSDSLRARRAGFTSQHDTLMASVVKTSKPGVKTVKPIERPENTAYTVQVGAFARTDHALRAQKSARERFTDLPIFNNFEPYDKLYRVRVGKFETRQQADSVRKLMLKQFPDDYSDSWINYISK